MQRAFPSRSFPRGATRTWICMLFCIGVISAAPGRSPAAEITGTNEIEPAPLVKYRAVLEQVLRQLEDAETNTDGVRFRAGAKHAKAERESGSLSLDELEYFRALAERHDFESRPGSNGVLLGLGSLGALSGYDGAARRLGIAQRALDRVRLSRLGAWDTSKSGFTAEVGGGALVKVGAHFNAPKVFFAETKFCIGLREQIDAYKISLGLDVSANFYLFSLGGLHLYTGVSAYGFAYGNPLFSYPGLSIGPQLGLQLRMVYAQAALYYDLASATFQVRAGVGLRL